jgi:hypothetical protein
MALVLSTDVKEISVQAFGNWFTFKAGQKKNMDPRIASFLTQEKSFMGFVELPGICEEEPGSEAAIGAEKDCLVRGRQNIVSYLESLIDNLEVSLQKDYDVAGIKTDVKRIEGRGHLPAYKHLAQLKAVEQSGQDEVLAEIMALKGTDGAPTSTDTRKTST